MSYGKILLSFLITTLSFSAFAQTSTTLSGYVKDGNETIAGASVLLKGTKIGTTTNNQGYYELTTTETGNLTLIVSYLGYQTSSSKITIKNNEKLSLNIVLNKEQNQLSDVNIAGKTKNQEVKESGFAVNAIETKRFANTTADLNQILNKSTGVKIREQGGMGSGFNFAINGLSGKQVRFFLDGIPMESFGGGMSLNNIPVNLAERIEVYKGVVPIELGSDALGGAVNVITDQHTKRFLDASYSYGSFNSSRAAINGRMTDEKTGLMFNFSGFHNYSDNDYLMRNNPKYDAAIKVTENNEVILRDARRFHDVYRSSMGQLDIGLSDKSWADKISVGFLYSNLYNEIQTGASQNNVIGNAHQKGNFYMPSVKYKKTDFLIKGLTANLMGSLSIDKSDVIDTSAYLYGWGGIIRPESVAGELRDIKTIYHYKNTSAIARANFSYEIDEQQSLNLNYTYNHFSRSATEEIMHVDNNPFDEPNTLSKSIIGLAYQNQMFNKKLTTTLFAKYYGLSTFVRKAVFLSGGTYSRQDSTTTKNNLGYGIASRYKITEQAGLKFSFEHAYRLQEAEELFGDGVSVSSNINLKPEESDNFNLGAYYTHQSGKNKFSVEGGYFFRNAKNLIFSSPGGKYSTFVNVGLAQINGFEGEFGYQYSNLLDFSVNASYQNAINNQEYDINSGLKDPTYSDRIPNQPWFFANASIGLGKDNMIGKNSRIQFNWSTQYVDWFYITWESRGSKESIDKIPSQLIHNIALSYSFERGKYNISAESFNVTNELAYDNFRLQKPGRSVFLKLRYFIK